MALVLERGRLFERLPQGAMVSVALSEEQLQPLLSERLSVAAINSPGQCAVAGDEPSILQLMARLEAQGIEHRRIHIDVAAHSHLIDPIMPAFESFVGRLKLKAPKLPFVSCVSGTWITEAEATSPQYWTRHLRHTVRFAQGVKTLLEDPKRVLLEVSPGRTLSSLARLQSERDVPVVTLASMRSAREEQPDLAFLLTTLGKLWMAGVPVAWAKVAARERRRRVVLPTYPFERQRHWLEPQALQAVTTGRSLEKRSDVSDWFYLPSWKRSLPPAPPRSAPRSAGCSSPTREGWGHSWPSGCPRRATRW